MSDHYEPEQQALFYIEGPDERGCVWMHGASSKDPWARNYVRPERSLSQPKGHCFSPKGPTKMAACGLAHPKGATPGATILGLKALSPRLCLNG